MSTKITVREAEITYRKTDVSLPDEQVTSSRNIHNIAKHLGHDMKLQEHMWVYAFSHRNELIGLFEVARGSMSYCPVDPRVLFRFPLEAHAAKFILVHNHPSGNPEPSSEDDSLTERLKESGEMLGFVMLDHVILGDDSYMSYADRGRI